MPQTPSDPLREGPPGSIARLEADALRASLKPLPRRDAAAASGASASREKPTGASTHAASPLATARGSESETETAGAEPYRPA